MSRLQDLDLRQLEAFATLISTGSVTAALNFYYLEAFLIAVVFYRVIAYLVSWGADKIEAALRVRT